MATCAVSAPHVSSCDWPSPVVSGRFWRPVSRGEREGAAAYQTKEYTPPSLACVGREVEVSVQHCAKPVFLHFLPVKIVNY